MAAMVASAEYKVVLLKAHWLLSPRCNVTSRPWLNHELMRWLRAIDGITVLRQQMFCCGWTRRYPIAVGLDLATPWGSKRFTAMSVCGRWHHRCNLVLASVKGANNPGPSPMNLLPCRLWRQYALRFPVEELF